VQSFLLQVVMAGPDSVLKIPHSGRGGQRNLENEVRVYDAVSDLSELHLMSAERVLVDACGDLAAVQLPRAHFDLDKWFKVTSVMGQGLHMPNQQLRTSVVSKMALQIFLGLHSLHTHARYVHCDIKPANVMVTGKLYTPIVVQWTGSDGEEITEFKKAFTVPTLKLADFGIARPEGALLLNSWGHQLQTCITSMRTSMCTPLLLIWSPADSCRT
jgi:Protein kinase domain